LSVNEFTTMTTASVHVTTWHLTACVWLGWMMSLHGVSVGVVFSYSGLVCSSSLCVVPPPAAHAPTPIRRSSDLLMVHAVLTLAAKVWLCGMTRV